MELGWTLPKRKHYLSELIKSASTRTYRIRFQGKAQDFSIFSVPIELPRYRLENGRTTGLQAEYLAANSEIDGDFFRADGESERAQKEQHKILVRLARDRKNLFNEFEKNTQEEPIILSSVGYVINGNRRLSTWRELLNINAAKYSHFSNIEAIVLPFCDERDLDRLEADLQIKPDLKADYGWISEALMIREKLGRFGYNEEDVASIYHLKKNEMTELLDCLEYAEQYLESRSMTSQYSKAEDKEYAFRPMSKSRRKMKNAPSIDKEIFEKAAFCLADKPATGTRTYAEVQKLAENLGSVSESLLEELVDDTADLTEWEKKDGLSSALSVPDNYDIAREIIVEALDAAAERKKDKKKRQHVANQIAKARECLDDAKTSITDQSSQSGVLASLDAIDELSRALREWVEENG
ncbi:MAG: hypothetical protein QNJ09_06960 [Paracoccaceae bacterium]|nr:hypothetical protein [Paracoccaceae bacterium]